MLTVFLIGDSIRMQYQDEAKKCLGAAYDVYGPEDNCRFAAYTLATLVGRWLAEIPKPDIVHWNNGLWDFLRRHWGVDGCFTPIDEYLRTMERILRELRKTGAKIILATSTPTLFAGEMDQFGASWNNSDAEEYNQKLLERLADKVDAVNDLYSLVFPKMDEYICEDKVHLSAAGMAACGKAVAEIIQRVYKKGAGE